MEEKRNFIYKHYPTLKIALLIFVTIIMFIALFFNEETPFTWDTIVKESKNYMIYICLLISFIGSYFIVTGAENIKKKKN